MGRLIDQDDVLMCLTGDITGMDIKDYIKMVATNIKALPTAQPTIEPSANCSEFPNNSDTISRQAAIDGKISIQRVNGVEIYTDEAVPVEHLKNVSAADVVPVVRCDDCVYYGSRRWCELHSSVFDDNAFCSYGERRNES